MRRVDMVTRRVGVSFFSAENDPLLRGSTCALNVSCWPCDTSNAGPNGDE
jgi:hypothetical protein